MNLPLILLGLYIGLLALALSLASWVGHAIPAPEAARRVTHAAERAALLHLQAPARLAAASVGSLAVVFAAYSFLQDANVWWALMSPLVGSALVLSALYFGVRKMLRTSAQVVGAEGADGQVTLISRSAIAAVLCAEVSVSLVLLGLHALVSERLPQAEAYRLVFATGAAIGLAALAISRGLAAAQLSSQDLSPAPGPHPGSLAALVAGAFHAPGLRLLSLVGLSAFGQSALLLWDSSEAEAKLWLFPHLLKLLGLLAVTFGALIVRTSENEERTTSWIRGGVVSLLLLIAGVWSLASGLPRAWERTLPAAATFFFVATVLFLFLNGRGTSGIESNGLGRERLHLPATLLLLGLVLVLVFSVGLLPEDLTLNSHELLRLLIAVALALAPASLLWLVARDLNHSCRHVSELSYLGTERPLVAPSARMVGLFPVLSLIVLSSALGGLIFLDPQTAPQNLLWGVGLALGGLIVWSLSGSVSQSSGGPLRKLNQLLVAHRQKERPADRLNLELAVDSCREATKGGVAWVILAVAPTLLVLACSTFLPAGSLKQFSLGLTSGAALLGLGMDWALGFAASQERRTLGALGHVACLSQGLWLLALGSYLG